MAGASAEGHGPRILFLAARYPPALGGAELQAEHLARALRQEGAQVEVLTTRVPGAPAEETLRGVPVHRRVGTIPVHGLWAASNLLGTTGFLLSRGGRYDAFLGFGLSSFLNPPALLRQRLPGRPLLLRCECSGPFGDLAVLRGMSSGRWLLGRAQRAAGVVALTGEMAAELVAAGFAPARVTVIPNGVDPDLFTPPAVSARSRDTLLFVGRLVPQKGLPVLLETVARLAPQHPGLRLEILGEGPERGALEARSGDLGIADRVRFRGLVAPGEVRAALAGAAALVHPSLGEGLCCSLLEAMASGCPIVATDIPANRELIVAAESGLLVAPGDPAALAAATARLLGEPGLAGSLGAGARRRARERFSIRAVARGYLEAFRAFGAPEQPPRASRTSAR